MGQRRRAVRASALLLGLLVAIGLLHPTGALAADSTATLRGAVTTADGGSLFSALVVVSKGATPVSYAHTSSTGEYEITGLATGDYDVRITHCCSAAPWIGEWGDGTHGAEQQTPTRLVAGSNILDVQVDAGGFISGSLTGSGEPLTGNFTLTPLEPVFPGATLRVFARSGELSSEPLPPGRYALVFDQHPEWLPEDHNGVQTTTPTNPALTVKLGQKLTVNADLAPAGEISGTVYIATGNGGRMPVAHASVSLTSLDGGHSPSAFTADDGTYVVRGVEGRYRVSFSAQSPATGYTTLPEYLGGTRTPEGSTIVEVRDNAVTGGHDAVLDTGGHVRGWAYYREALGGELRNVTSQFSTFMWFKRDEITGADVRVASPGWAHPIASMPVTAALEPGTYTLRVRASHWTGGDPWAEGAEHMTFTGERTGIVVRADEFTDIGQLILETRHHDVSRAAGADRYATSAAVSAASFAPGVPVAYLANGTTFPDALSGAAAAGALGGPVLLTPQGTLPTVIANELDRLNPAKIVILGGTGAVSEAVRAEARAYSPVVTRASGADRYATSAAVSASTFTPGVPVAYLANGTTFPDALSGAASAGALGGPVLLTPQGTLPTVIANELDRLNPAKIVILGGTGAVSEAVRAKARAYSAMVIRASGADRYATSAAISASTFAPGVPVAYLANGTTFPDALSGAASAGALGGPVLLTPQGTLPTVIEEELDRLNPGKIVILGGTGAVDQAVLVRAREILSY